MLRSLLLSFCALPLAAQAPDPTLARLPADTASLVVLRDVMPHVDSFLGSPLVRELLATTGELQQELFGRRFDAAALQKQISVFRALVPAEATIAMSAPSTLALLELLRGTALAAVLVQWPDAGDDDTRDALRKSCAEALRAAPGVHLVAAVRTRDVRTAEGWFDDVAEAVKELKLGTGWDAKVADATLTLQVAPLQMRDGAVRRALAAAGIELPADFEPRFAATLTQDGARLELRLGAPAAGPLPGAKLGRLWRGDATQLLYAQAEFGNAAEAFLEDFAAVQELLDAGVTSPMLTRVAALLSQCSDLSVKYGGSVAVADRGLAFVAEYDFGELPEEIDAPPVEFARCVVPAEGPFSLNSLPLDFLLSAWFDQMQTRVWRRGAPMPKELGPLMEFLQDERSAVFAPGTLLVSRRGTFRGAKGLAAGKMPWAVGAVVAKTDGADEARRFMRELGEHLGALLGRTEPLWVDADLGLGQPTQALDPAAVPLLRDVDADFRPHWLVVGDSLVISSDVAFTKDLLQRLGGKDGAPLPAGRLVDWTICRGDHLAEVVQGVAAWLPHLDANAASKGAQVLGAAGALCRAVDAFEWITDLDGTILRTRMELRLRAGPK